jgi:hypothetical protein
MASTCRLIASAPTSHIGIAPRWIVGNHSGGGGEHEWIPDSQGGPPYQNECLGVFAMRPLISKPRQLLPTLTTTPTVPPTETHHYEIVQRDSNYQEQRGRVVIAATEHPSYMLTLPGMRCHTIKHTITTSQPIGLTWLWSPTSWHCCIVQSGGAMPVPWVTSSLSHKIWLSLF